MTDPAQWIMVANSRKQDRYTAEFFTVVKTQYTLA